MVRVAVAPGADRTRVAVADPAPRVVAELAGRVDPGEAVRLLFGRPVDPLVVGVDAAAAVGGEAARLVVDAGASGTRVSVVDGSRVTATIRVPVGGTACDAALAAALHVDPAVARAARERFARRSTAARELLATVLAEVVVVVADAARAHRVREVVLVGGLARDPLLAELLDAAGVTGVRVAADPAAALVLAAVSDAPRAPDAPGTGPVPRLLPAPRRRPWRPVAATVALLLVLGAGTGLLLYGGGNAGRVAPATAPAAATLAQYGYRFTLPEGWVHTGGRPERRRTVVTPRDVPNGVELVAVERTDLGYDAALEPRRAAAELRAVFDAAVAAGEPLSGWAVGVRAGRPVTTYVQLLADGALVDWTVLLDGPAQLSVGCRHGPVTSGALTRACAEVVGSVVRA
jgi:type VII secretion-associated protein (TIGR03931 family)